MDFLKSMQIAASGLRAQTGRMQVIAENVANADSTAQRPGGDPYRRKIPTFRSEVDRALEANTVTMGKIRPDPTDFRTKYEPFFFSSRRRHTRWNCDWSSDVCSSD